MGLGPRGKHCFLCAQLHFRLGLRKCLDSDLAAIVRLECHRVGSCRGLVREAARSGAVGGTPREHPQPRHSFETVASPLLSSSFTSVPYLASSISISIELLKNRSLLKRATAAICAR